MLQEMRAFVGHYCWVYIITAVCQASPIADAKVSVG